jgi:limonene-1,2-epoxide hydrolase
MNVTLVTIGEHITEELKLCKNAPSPGLLSFGIWLHSTLTDAEIIFLERVDDEVGNRWLHSVLLMSGLYTIENGHLALK